MKQHHHSWIGSIVLVLMLLLILLLTLQQAAALGIRPAKTSIDSEETKKLDGTFWIVNNDHLEFTVRVYVEGELAEYVKLNDKKEISFRQDDDAKPIEFSIKLPKEIPPGKATADIVIEQELESPSSDTISSKLLLRHKIEVLGPYPDKYIVAKLNFQEQGKKIRLVAEVENKGKKDLGTVQTRFYVNDRQQKQQVLETEAAPLAKDENKLLATEIDQALFGVGEFNVLASISYDDQKLELEKKMMIGKPEIDIAYFDRFLIANKINKYSLDLMNKWNKEIRNVFVEVEVKKQEAEGKKEEQKVDEFRTKSIDIEGLATRRINDYYNAEGREKGKYHFDMVVNFWNNVRMEQKRFPVEMVSEEEIENIDLRKNLAGKAAGQSSSGTSPWLWISIAIGTAVFTAGVIWMLRIRMLRRKRQQGDAF
ncbi:hypothetical protein HYX14_01945 [Candidatus Woesearchaeota archaeon]|nr:hypothetical protein [Candidatus Woesearchaeota archaeon]